MADRYHQRILDRVDEDAESTVPTTAAVHARNSLATLRIDGNSMRSKTSVVNDGGIQLVGSGNALSLLWHFVVGFQNERLLHDKGTRRMD